MDHIEVRCVKVGMFDQIEQSKICVLTVTILGIVRLTLQHDLEFNICFFQDPGDFLTETSLDILPSKQCPLRVSQTSGFICCLPVFLCVHKQNLLE